MLIILDIWSVFGIFVISFILGVVVGRYVQHQINSKSQTCNCNENEEIIVKKEEIVINKDDNSLRETNFPELHYNNVKYNREFCRRCGKADWGLHNGFCSDCFEWAYID